MRNIYCSSPKNRNRNSLDHSAAGTPLKPVTGTPGSGFYGGAPFPGSNGARRSSKPAINGVGRGKGRGKKGGEMGFGYGGTEDGFDGLDSPMSADGDETHQQVNGLHGEGMDEVSRGRGT